MIIRRFLALIKIIVTLISQLLQRRHTTGYAAAASAPTCRTTRTVRPRFRARSRYRHSTSTGHPPQSRRTRIDHSGWSTWIKLDGIGTFHDTPYCPGMRCLGRFAFARISHRNFFLSDSRQFIKPRDVITSHSDQPRFGPQSARTGNHP